MTARATREPTASAPVPTDRHREQIDPAHILAVLQIEEPLEWRRARLDRLAGVSGRLRHQMVYGPLAGMHEALHYANSATAATLDPRWMPARPPRKMPSLASIVRHWMECDTFPSVRFDEPHCFGCWREAPTWTGRYFDRAHLVDRQVGGLDHVGNMVPLCLLCHRVMPMFEIDEGDKAIAWVLNGGRDGVIMEIVQSMMESSPA